MGSGMGREGRAERHLLPGGAMGSGGRLAGPQGEEGCRWLRRREWLRHFSQVFLAQPYASPTAHGSPLDPKEGLCWDSRH